MQLLLYNTALNEFVSEGVNCSVVSFAGTSSNTDRYFLKRRINVNTDSPTSRKFVMGSRTITTHITCFDRFMSNLVEKQCKDMVNVVNDVSDTWSGLFCQ